MSKGTETKYEDDPIETQHDRSFGNDTNLHHECGFSTAYFSWNHEYYWTFASGDRILSVKSSIDGTGWNEQYRKRLEKFVNITHTTTTHPYSLSKFIFLCALQYDSNFDIGSYINKEFFSEVWLSLVHYRCGRVGEATARRRIFISQYIQRYLDNTTYESPGLKYAQQSFSIEGLKIYTAYTNNIGTYFDNHFRRAINTLLQIRQRKIDLIRQRQEEGVDNEAISKEIHEQITLPAIQFKEILASRIIDSSSIELPF
ncbi:hypothetical protein G6F37_006611 [Rhizopus arrhizus]|nr:hypothetical protein G6F38_006107 [Rhizopus arrhizus]KAG1157542.1 hypothetical protein G6F37_006611 [Rhizopus arrhizus]